MDTISLNTENEYEQYWYDYKNNPPELGEEVIAYSSKWIEKIGNPKGIRIGWREENTLYDGGDNFISAYYDETKYITVDKLMNNDQNYENIYDYVALAKRIELRNTADPEYWMPTPKFNIDKVREKDETDCI